jgi:hypothetical protein
MNSLLVSLTDCGTAANASIGAIGPTVQERLRQSGYLPLRDATCIAIDGVVHLQGRLPSYYHKQVSQELTAGVEGVRHVMNRIEVFVPAPSRLGRGILANQSV